MPEYKLDSVEKTQVTWSMTPDDLWNSRVESNQKILGSLWESEYDDEVHETTNQDAEEGCNTVPEEATEKRCAEVCLTRRMAVPELKEKIHADGSVEDYTRVRPCDDETEGGKHFAFQSSHHQV